MGRANSPGNIVREVIDHTQEPIKSSVTLKSKGSFDSRLITPTPAYVPGKRVH